MKKKKVIKYLEELLSCLALNECTFTETSGKKTSVLCWFFFFFYFTDETNEIQTQVVVNSFRPPVTSFVVYIQFIHHYC